MRSDMEFNPLEFERFGNRVKAMGGFDHSGIRENRYLSPAKFAIDQAEIAFVFCAMRVSSRILFDPNHERMSSCTSTR